MEIPPVLLQFLGSLAAILVLAAIARRLKLGPDRLLQDENAARDAAREVADGFDPVAVTLDRHGRGAVLHDAGGNIMLLRLHGTHVVGRVLTSRARARIDGDRLIVDTGERRFGCATFEIDNASAWAGRIDELKMGRDA
ncbi:hypothetical protein [Qipengyuania sp. MTN3-11]|uniref:hypothetical protein n=1 Tax=Qipengyuania sp. MTN3-11 TaxID=3056557 RepID=UPI0036F3BF6D